MCELVMEYNQDDINEAPELAEENEVVGVEMCEAYQHEFDELGELSRELWDISDWLRVLTYEAGFEDQDDYALESEKGFDKVAELHERHNEVMAKYLEVKKKAEGIRAVCRG